MKEDDSLKSNDNKPLELTIYKPEEQAYQKLHLCEYLRELFEVVEKENGHSREKEDYPNSHLLKERE